MTDYIPHPQIAVLDTGGQYTHLIARKVRELGVYADVLPSETPASNSAAAKGLIISGGPASVYEPGSPTVDPAHLSSRIRGPRDLLRPAVDGAAPRRRRPKGRQGRVRPGHARHLSTPARSLPAAAGPPADLDEPPRHGRARRPRASRCSGSTGTCAIAAIAAPDRRLYGVQFHPEVVHTQHGRQILSNFLFDICRLREATGIRGIVYRSSNSESAKWWAIATSSSSSAAASIRPSPITLCLRALGEDRVSGFYVDTGLMREGETAFVRDLFAELGSRNFSVEEAGEQFLGALAGRLRSRREAP